MSLFPIWVQMVCTVNNSLLWGPNLQVFKHKFHNRKPHCALRSMFHCHIYISVKLQEFRTYISMLFSTQLRLTVGCNKSFTNAKHNSNIHYHPNKLFEFQKVEWYGISECQRLCSMEIPIIPATHMEYINCHQYLVAIYPPRGRVPIQAWVCKLLIGVPIHKQGLGGVSKRLMSS